MAKKTKSGDLLKFLKKQIISDMMPIEEMASFRKKTTGIDNIIFISPKGGARHSARIKVAIDPPDSISPSSGCVSVEVSDYSVHGTLKVSTDLYTKLKKFIDINRSVIIDYWNYKISTDEMTSKLRGV